jgi:hypothetical protein
MKAREKEKQNNQKHTFSTSGKPSNTFPFASIHLLTLPRGQFHTTQDSRSHVPEPRVPLNRLSQIPSVVLAQRRSKRDDGLHTYKHRHVHAEEVSTPCRHRGGYRCGFAHRSRSRGPFASEHRHSFSAGLGECRENFLLGVFVLVVVHFRE